MSPNIFFQYFCYPLLPPRDNPMKRIQIPGWRNWGCRWWRWLRSYHPARQVSDNQCACDINRKWLSCPVSKAHTALSAGPSTSECPVSSPVGRNGSAARYRIHGTDRLSVARNRWPSGVPWPIRTATCPSASRNPAPARSAPPGNSHNDAYHSALREPHLPPVLATIGRPDSGRRPAGRIPAACRCRVDS